MEYEDSLNKLDRGEYDREIEISSDEDQVIDHQDKNLNELIDRINKFLQMRSKDGLFLKEISEYT